MNMIITVKMDNAAFDIAPIGEALEAVTKALTGQNRNLATKSDIERFGKLFCPVFDHNGNRVGQIEVTA